MKRPVDLPLALFRFSAANAVALDLANELVLGNDSNAFCSVWEQGYSDIHEGLLTGLVEDLYNASVPRQTKFLATWATALAMRTR